LHEAWSNQELLQLAPNSFFLLSSNKCSPFSFFFGPGFLRHFAQGVFSLFDELKSKSLVIIVSNHCPRGSLPTSPIFYFKLPYIGHFSVVTQRKIRHFIKRYCNDLDIKLVFSSFKIGHMFGVKDPILCAGRNACYLGETTRHFSTRVRKHLFGNNACHVFKHLQNSEHCRTLCSVDCFHILDHAPTGFQLKIKEAIHIQREQPSLNQQLHQVNLKLSL